MTGNLHVLLAIAQSIVSFLPAVGPTAARRSRAAFGRVADSLEARSGRKRLDLADSNAAGAVEAVAP